MKYVHNRFHVCCSTCGLVETYPSWEMAEKRGMAHAEGRDKDITVEVFDSMAHRNAIRLKEYDRETKSWKVTHINN